MERRGLINPQGRGGLSVRRQCRLLSVSRSGLYYKESPENLKLMRLMDEHALQHPAEGVMSMVYMLRSQGYGINPKQSLNFGDATDGTLP